MRPEDYLYLRDFRTGRRGDALRAEISRLEEMGKRTILSCDTRSRLADLRADLVRAEAPAGARFALVVWGTGLASDASQLFPSPDAAAAKVAELKEVRWSQWEGGERVSRPIPRIHISMDRADGQPGSECTTYAPRQGGGWVEDHYLTSGETFG